MTELKCPFCQQEMIIPKDDTCFGQQRCVCRNPNCEFDGWHFPVKLVSELIRTKKELDDILDKHEKLLKHIAIRSNREQELRNKLDIAVDVLKDFANAGKESEQEWFGVAVKNNAQKALEQITALEQINQKD